MPKDSEFIHPIKTKEKSSRPKVTEFISGDSSKKEEFITVYFDKDGESGEEKSSYAKIETHVVNGQKQGEKYFISFNVSDMCHPEVNRKKTTSSFREVKSVPFLHYMDFLINKKERQYELAQKKQREQKTM